MELEDTNWVPNGCPSGKFVRYLLYEDFRPFDIEGDIRPTDLFARVPEDDVAEWGPEPVDPDSMFEVGRSLDYAVKYIRDCMREGFTWGPDPNLSQTSKTHLGGVGRLIDDIRTRWIFDDDAYDSTTDAGGFSLRWSDTLGEWQCGHNTVEGMHPVGRTEREGMPALAVVRAWLVLAHRTIRNDEEAP